MIAVWAPTAGPNGHAVDLQLVADVHGLAGRAELSGGLRIGVQRGARVALEQRREPCYVDVVRVLVGDQDGGQTSDSLETVCEGPGVKEQACVAELGKKAGVAEMR